jgi:8-oxo-dGTP pyrophosphatase MutT (NUDIX family)
MVKPHLGCCREAKEELGIDIDQADLALVHVMHQREGGSRSSLRSRNGLVTIVNAERDKCEALDWILKDDLPENSVPYAKAALS